MITVKGFTVDEAGHKTDHGLRLEPFYTAEEAVAYALAIIKQDKPAPGVWTIELTVAP